MWFFEALALGFCGRLIWRLYQKTAPEVFIKEVKHLFMLAACFFGLVVIGIIVLAFVALKMYP